MGLRLTLAVFTVAVGVACDSGRGHDAAVAEPATVTAEPWQRLVDEVAASNPGVPGVALAVLGDDVDVAVAAGSGGPDRDDPLTPDRPFRIASNTKTFTAAAVLRLVEDGELTLDQSVDELADPELVDLLRADGYDTAAITVGHLLDHRAGLYDYAADVDFQTLVLGGPSRRWERVDQVEFAVRRGDPIAEPGGAFAYSDTGYVLLGDIVERLTGEDLGTALRGLVGFARLGLDSTWLEDVEEPPAGVAEQASQYYETRDMIDTDPSFDLHGGGGLVSTVGDLARFARALLDGEVFVDPATLETMLEVPTENAEAGAAKGLFRLEHPDLGTCWSHSGFWGTFVAACPDVTVAVSVFQANPDPPFDGADLLERVVRALT